MSNHNQISMNSMSFKLLKIGRGTWHVKGLEIMLSFAKLRFGSLSEVASHGTNWHRSRVCGNCLYFYNLIKETKYDPRAKWISIVCCYCYLFEPLCFYFRLLLDDFIECWRRLAGTPIQSKPNNWYLTRLSLCCMIN